MHHFCFRATPSLLFTLLFCIQHSTITYRQNPECGKMLDLLNAWPLQSILCMCNKAFFPLQTWMFLIFTHMRLIVYVDRFLPSSLSFPWSSPTSGTFSSSSYRKCVLFKFVSLLLAMAFLCWSSFLTQFLLLSVFLAIVTSSILPSFASHADDVICVFHKAAPLCEEWWGRYECVSEFHAPTDIRWSAHSTAHMTERGRAQQKIKFPHFFSSLC